MSLGSPAAINSFLREYWRIVPDPETAELVRTPERQIWDYNDDQRLAGDCDDAATLAASLLLVLGIGSVLIAIRMPYEMEFSHVFLRVPMNGGFLDIDPIVPSSRLPIEGYAETMEFIV